MQPRRVLIALNLFLTFATFSVVSAYEQSDLLYKTVQSRSSECGAQLNTAQYSLKKNPLHQADSNCDPAMVRVLLEGGASPDSQPLFYVYWHRSGENAQEIVNILVDHGADVNVRDKMGWAPLDTTANLGFLCNKEAARALVRCGAIVSPGVREKLHERRVLLSGNQELNRERREFYDELVKISEELKSEEL